jgi:choline monooxygenase
MIVTTVENPSTTALDPRLYGDPDGTAQEQTAIFARTWQLAGHVADLAAPGRFVTVQAGNESAIAIRGEDGELRAFRNVCRHRASRLREGRGDCGKVLRCPYHGWTYGTDGRPIGVRDGGGLIPARVETFAGLVFVNLDLDASPLADGLDGLAQKLAPYGIEKLERVNESTSSRRANWKVVADNDLEGHHVPIVLPPLDHQRHTVEVGDGHVYCEAPLGQKLPGLTAADKRVWRHVYLWPNTTIDLYPGEVTTRQINPRGIAATHDVWACYRAADPTPAMRVLERVGVDVSGEDGNLVATSGWTPGPPGERDAAVAWFAGHVRRALEAAG